MAYNQIPATTENIVVKGFAVGGSGLYALATPLTFGVYTFETDTSQNFTISLVNSTNNYAHNGTIRNGKGYVSVGSTVDYIYVTPLASLNYPFALTITKMNSPQITTAPVVTGITWASDKTTVTGTWSSVPAGTVSMTLAYNTLGNNAGSWVNLNFPSITSGATISVAQANRPKANASGIPYAVFANDVNGVTSLGHWYNWCSTCCNIHYYLHK